MCVFVMPLGGKSHNRDVTAAGGQAQINDNDRATFGFPLYPISAPGRSGEPLATARASSTEKKALTVFKARPAGTLNSPSRAACNTTVRSASTDLLRRKRPRNTCFRGSGKSMFSAFKAAWRLSKARKRLGTWVKGHIC